MKLQPISQFLSETDLDGKVLSIVEMPEMKVIASNVSVMDIGPCNVTVGRICWPLISGGKYNGHRLAVGGTIVPVGEYILFYDSETKKTK